jgi:DNA excision repair protein ERCC-2
VVQAAGRVIRSMTDRGVIVLLGRRFAEPRWHDALPEEWRDDPAGPLLVDDLEVELVRFWAEAHARDQNP